MRVIRRPRIEKALGFRPSLKTGDEGLLPWTVVLRREGAASGVRQGVQLARPPEDFRRSARLPHGRQPAWRWHLGARYSEAGLQSLKSTAASAALTHKFY
eukprot:scaffold133234_cov66-Phaeocystis_antarctica.AAC.7